MPKRVDVPRPDYDRQNGAHARMQQTGDVFEKLYGGDGDRERYESLLEVFSEPMRVMLYTVGEATVFQGPAHASISNPTTYHGFKTNESELATLSRLGTIVHAEEFRPHVTMTVASKQALRDVLALGFVYAAQLDRPVLFNDIIIDGPASQDATYSLTWGQKKQKVTYAWNSRESDDATASPNGMLPRDIRVAVIDGGYNAATTKFIEAYAADQVTHCHTVSGGSEGAAWTSPVPAGQSVPNPVACGSSTSADDEHGTLVADILSAYNREGGDLHVYNLGNPFISDLRAAYNHVDSSHPEVRVISSSATAPIGDSNCRGNGPGFFDDILKDLAINKKTLISVSREDHGFPSGYPESTTWVTAVGGALDGSPWIRDASSPAGLITLTSQCTLQRALHQGTTEPSSLFKPDVYGFYIQLVDATNPDGTHQRWGGTSFAQPQIASGLATIASRTITRGESVMPFKQWHATSNDWCGAVRLIWASASPDGRGVGGASDSMRGNLADHDAWYLDGNGC